LVSIAQAVERFSHDLGADNAKFIKDGMGAGAQMEAPNAAVGGVGPTLDEIGLGEPVNHAAHRDGFDVKRFSKAGLVDAFNPREREHDLPLGAADAEAAGTRIEPATKQASGIADEKS
jgi:hypothetical protein